MTYSDPILNCSETPILFRLAELLTLLNTVVDVHVLLTKDSNMASSPYPSTERGDSNLTPKVSAGARGAPLEGGQEAFCPGKF